MKPLLPHAFAADDTRCPAWPSGSHAVYQFLPAAPGSEALIPTYTNMVSVIETKLSESSLQLLNEKNALGRFPRPNDVASHRLPADMITYTVSIYGVRRCYELHVLMPHYCLNLSRLAGDLCVP